MFLSIVIPAYNCEKFIENTINNIKSQNIDDYEIIVVNDGSTDNTLNILNSLDNIKIIDQKNSGAASARNNGLKNASGKYVFFMDADDLLYENCLNSIVNVLRKENIDVLIGLYTMYINDEKVFDVDSSIKEYEVNNKDIDIVLNVLNKYRLSPCPWRYFLKREFLIDNNLYFKIGSVVEDAIWVPMMLSKANSFYLEDKPFYKYIVNNFSVSTTKKFKFYEDTLEGFNILYDYSSNLDYVRKNLVYKYMMILLLGLIRDYTLFDKNQKNIVNIWIKNNKFTILKALSSMKYVHIFSLVFGVNLTLQILGFILRKKVK